MTDSALLMAQKFALSSTAAAIAESCTSLAKVVSEIAHDGYGTRCVVATFPLDLTKIRMQTANMYTSSSTVSHHEVQKHRIASSTWV
jgi:hypothetical protein